MARFAILLPPVLVLAVVDPFLAGIVAVLIGATAPANRAG
jgi:hypothetical protein